MRRLLPPLALALVLAGCGSETRDQGELPSMEATGSPSSASLHVVLDRGDGTEPETWTLHCGGTAEGTHPDPRAACAHLAGLEAPFAPLPEDTVCTQQFGGPETADVVGRWAGEPVDLALSRSDGCRIAQWDLLGPLLAPAG